MNKIVRKFFFAWQQEKEQAFLEKYAKEGYMLSKVGFGRYEFHQDVKQEVVYQMDFQILDPKKEEEYLSLFEEWEFVDKFGTWYYFRKVIHEPSERENAKLYMDYHSKRDMFKRLFVFLFLVSLPLYYQVVILFPNLSITFPHYFFFYQIFIYLLLVLHVYAVFHFIAIYITMKNQMKE